MKHQIVVAEFEKVERFLPQNLSIEDIALFRNEKEKTLCNTIFYEQDSLFIYPNGFIASPLTIVPHHLSFSQKQGVSVFLKNIAKLFLQRLKSRKVNKILEPIFFPCDEHSNGFFHWIGDVLPRIELFVEKFGLDELRKRTLVIPSMADFAYVLPSLVPYKMDSILIVKPQERVIARIVGTMSPVAPTGNFRPEIMRALRARYQAFFCDLPSNRPSQRKLFLSRQKASRRTIVNEELLWPVFEARGFERLVIEDLDFSAQVRTVGEAHILAGLHGAGLTNMLWMAEGSKVLEIRFKGDNENNCYFSLASALGLPYYYLLAEKQGPMDSVQNANAIVDAQAVDRVLANMLQEN